MFLLDKFIHLFYDQAAVVNEDEQALKQEVQLLQKKYGSWFKIRGFADYKEFFLAIHTARLNHCPFTVAFLKNSDEAGALILKKTDPTIQTYIYSNTQELSTHLPALR